MSFFMELFEYSLNYNAYCQTNTFALINDIDKMLEIINLK